MKNWKSVVINILIGLGILVLSISVFSPFALYFHHFSDYEISPDPQKWGPFGDFFGGILNPILALINIGFLFYISNKVSQIEDRRHLNEFRHLAYKELIEFIDEINDNYFIRPDEKFHYSTDVCIDKLTKKINNYYTNNYFLFRNEKKTFRELVIDLTANLESIREEVNYIKNEEEEMNYQSDEFTYTTKLTEGLANFYKNRKELKFFIQKVMLNLPIQNSPTVPLKSTSPVAEQAK